jgi:hypothetical protein
MSDEPSNAVRILTYPIDMATLKKLGDRRRNQLFGSMHAHNELSFLNRLLLFTQGCLQIACLSSAGASPWPPMSPRASLLRCGSGECVATQPTDRRA